MNIKDVVNKSDTILGRVFDWSVLGLIVFSIVTLSIETLPDLEKQTRRWLWYSEVVVSVLFTLEYFLRIYASDKAFRYIFSFYGLIDLIAIIPFYLSFGVDLRGVRAFRLFRIIRILKITRYSRAVRRFRQAVAIAKEEVVLFLFATAIVLYLSSIGIYYFEHQAQPENFQSVFHSMWWAVATLTTVGYGDVYPITIGGKIFTFLMLMIGLGIVAVPAGLVATALSEVRKNEEES